MVVCGLNWGAELVGEATVVRRQIQICLSSQIRLAGIVRAPWPAGGNNVCAGLCLAHLCLTKCMIHAYRIYH